MDIGNIDDIEFSGFYRVDFDIDNMPDSNNSEVKEKISEMIEDYVKEHKSTYFEAILNFQKQFDIDEKEVKKYLVGTVIEKLHYECVELKMVKDQKLQDASEFFD